MPKLTPTPPPLCSAELVFSTIEQAARLIAMVGPGALAEAIRAQLDRAFYADPTLAQTAMAKSEDLARKLKILDDCQRLLSNWTVGVDAAGIDIRNRSHNILNL